MSEERDPKKVAVHPLDEELRRAFKGVVEEDLPNRFVRLLEQLRDGTVPETKDDEGSAT